MQRPATQRETLPNDIGKLIQRLKEELKCSICLSVFDDPTITPCNHTFCRECIERAVGMVKKSSTTPVNECPICKSKTPKRSLNSCSAAAKLCSIYEEIVRAYSEMIGGNEDWIHEAGVRANDAYYTGGGVPLDNLSQLYPYPEKPKASQPTKTLQNISENADESSISDLFDDLSSESTELAEPDDLTEPELTELTDLDEESRIYDETTQLEPTTQLSFDRPEQKKTDSLTIPNIPSSPLIYPSESQLNCGRITINTQEWEKLEAINESIDRELEELEKKLEATSKEEGKDKENEGAHCNESANLKQQTTKSTKGVKVKPRTESKTKVKEDSEISRKKPKLDSKAKTKVEISVSEADSKSNFSVPKSLTTTAIKDEASLIQLTKFSDKFNIPILQDLQNSDHLIIPTDSNLIVKKRTMKYFEALLLQKEIISFRWIGACLKAGKLLNYAPYLIKGDEIGMKQGKKSSQRSTDYQKIFSNYKFYFYGEFSQPPRDQLEKLVQSFNGLIFQDVNELVKGSIVLADPTSQFTFEKDAMIIKKYPIVSPTWLLDSISCGRVLDFSGYLIL